mmetsp:Transcript_35717/g.45444  ORF Transcript_35717/g.45444 Transcript_35717/m.45444 type:complete len:384 (+) Transcript_35717:153-1304(+)
MNNTQTTKKASPPAAKGDRKKKAKREMPFDQHQTIYLNKRRREATLEYKKQKAMKDRMRVCDKEYVALTNRINHENRKMKQKQFDIEMEEKTKNNQWPECFDKPYGNLFFKNPRSKSKYQQLQEQGYCLISGPAHQAGIMQSVLETAKAGDTHKRPGPYPRNFGDKYYIFDTQNSSSTKHSLRWVRPLKANWLGEDHKKYPATKGATLVLQQVLEQHVDTRSNKLEVYGVCELGSDPVATVARNKAPTVLQLWHRDDTYGRARYGFSVIYNTSDQPAFLRVATGSHQMTHAEQFELDVTKQKSMLQLVTIQPGQCILFHRNLLHQGASYETEQVRIFAYVEIWPKEYKAKDVINHADAGVTSKYVAPGENDVSPLKTVEQLKK